MTGARAFAVPVLWIAGLLTGCAAPRPTSPPSGSTERAPPGWALGAGPRPADAAAPLRARRYLGFDAAKRALARDVYGDRRSDVYCGCAFDEALRVDPTGCGYSPRASRSRGDRIEWEHLMPAARFGASLACWRGETEGCKAARVRGRKCCGRSVERGGDAAFRQMEGDLHNLAPSVGELNGDRSDRPFGLVAGEPRKYGRCNFEIDFEAGRAGPTEPPERVWGDVARAWLYMSDEHEIPLSPDERRLLSTWHRADPPDPWETTRNARIAAIQGNHSRWVSPND